MNMQNIFERGFLSEEIDLDQQRLDLFFYGHRSALQFGTLH